MSQRKKPLRRRLFRPFGSCTTETTAAAPAKWSERAIDLAGTAGQEQLKEHAAVATAAFADAIGHQAPATAVPSASATGHRAVDPRVVGHIKTLSRILGDVTASINDQSQVQHHVQNDRMKMLVCVVLVMTHAIALNLHALTPYVNHLSSGLFGVLLLWLLYGPDLKSQPGTPTKPCPRRDIMSLVAELNSLSVRIQDLDQEVQEKAASQRPSNPTTGSAMGKAGSVMKNVEQAAAAAASLVATSHTPREPVAIAGQPDMNHFPCVVKENEGYVDWEFPLTGEMFTNFFAGMGLNFEESEHWKALTPEERTKLQQCEAAVADALDAYPADERAKIATPDRFTLVRFLKADNFVVATATKRLMGTIAWKRKKGWVDGEQVPPPAKFKIFREYRVRRYLGYDIHQNPVFIERLGESMSTIAKHIPNLMTVDEFVDCYVYEFGQVIERFRELAKLTGKAQWKMTYIGDLKGARFRDTLRSIPHFKACVRDAEVHFPELAGRIFLPHTGVVAKLWPMAKKFLDPSVATKVAIIQEACNQSMFDEIGESILLPEHGGTSKVVVPNMPK